jgi:hypothetical protein
MGLFLLSYKNMITYKLAGMYMGQQNTAILRSDGACIPPDESNTDYQAYLKWLAEGNTPLPADELQLPVVEEATPVVEEATSVAEEATPTDEPSEG